MPLDLEHPRGPRTIGDGPGYRTPEHEERKKEMKVLMGLRANSRLDHIEEEKQKVAIKIRQKELKDKDEQTEKTAYIFRSVPSQEERQAYWTKLMDEKPLVPKRYPVYDRPHGMDTHALIE